MTVITKTDTKRCFRCETYKEQSMFQSGSYECKPCAYNFRKKYYKQRQAKVAQGGKRSIDRNRQYVYDYLFNHPCTDCGEADIVVLEFDHTTDNKQHNIAKLMTRSYSLDLLKAEMEKCEVVCCNCHRKRTAKRGNWMKLDFSTLPYRKVGE